MSTAYTRTSDFVTPGSHQSRRAEKFNAELDKIATSIASLLVDPTFTGDARAVTRAITDDSTRLATTEFVHDVLAGALGNLPVQTGQAGEWLKTNGTSASWEPLPQSTRAIFDAGSASLTAVSALERLENSLPSTGLGAALDEVIYGASLFVAAVGGAANANVASSADGETWTLRAMPSNSRWHIGTDGTQFVAVVDGGTAVATSANGTTWTSTTALSAASKATYGIPVFQGTTCFVLGNTAATAHTSTDYGTSWTAQTLPDTAGSYAPFVVGGLIWYHTASSAIAHTSATGATGSWTQRNLAFTVGSKVWQDFDGSLWAIASDGISYYRTTDGINWTLQTFPTPLSANNEAVFSINGIKATFATTFGNAASYHNSAWVRRTPGFAFDAAGGVKRAAKNAGGTVFLLAGPTAGRIARIAPAGVDAATAVFTS